MAIWGYDTGAHTYSLSRAQGVNEMRESPRLQNLGVVLALVDKQDGGAGAFSHYFEKILKI